MTFSVVVFVMIGELYKGDGPVDAGFVSCAVAGWLIEHPLTVRAPESCSGETQRDLISAAILSDNGFNPAA
jgi:hypothetical protein